MTMAGPPEDNSSYSEVKADNEMSNDQPKNDEETSQEQSSCMLVEDRISAAQEQGSRLLKAEEFCISEVNVETPDAGWNIKKGFKNWKAESESKSCWILLFLFMLPCNILSGIEIVTFSVYYVAYAEHFANSSRMILGLIFSLKMCTVSFAGIVTSVMIDRYGCNRVCMASGVFMFCTLAGSSFVTTVYALHITQGFLMGIGMSCSMLSVSIAVQKRFRRNRALAAGVAMLGITIGNSIGGPLINYLVQKYTWRGAVLINSSIMLNLLPLGILLPTADKVCHKAGETHNERTHCCNKVKVLFKAIFDFRLLKKVPFLLLCLGAAMEIINMQTFLAHMPSRAVHLGMSNTEAASFISVQAIGNAISRIFITFISNLKSANQILITGVGCLFGTIGSTIIASTKDYWGQLVGTVLHGIHIGFVNTVAVVMLVSLLGLESLSRALAVYQMFFGISGLITSPLGGLLYDVTGDYDPPFILATVAGAVATGLVLVADVIDRKQRKSRGWENTKAVEVETTVMTHELHEHCELGEKESIGEETTVINHKPRAQDDMPAA